MNAIKKETQATQDFDQLKVRLKSTRMMGRPRPFSGYLEEEAERFFRRLGVTSAIGLLDVGCGAAPHPI